MLVCEMALLSSSMQLVSVYVVCHLKLIKKFGHKNSHNNSITLCYVMLWNKLEKYRNTGRGGKTQTFQRKTERRYGVKERKKWQNEHK